MGAANCPVNSPPASFLELSCTPPATTLSKQAAQLQEKMAERRASKRERRKPQLFGTFGAAEDAEVGLGQGAGALQACVEIRLCPAASRGAPAALLACWRCPAGSVCSPGVSSCWRARLQRPAPPAAATPACRAI